ncbi:MAG: rRNA pseudouridine synthase [Candidatus Eremiobacteraeota bacterium]|nr:rRNA pseudouridine synthase [Candidatus Eremiobacteraeota bacterium]
MSVGVRLNRYLAQCGVASRRHADELISRGGVRVNGRVVRELGTVVDCEDRIEVEGRILSAPREFTYLILNKPVGVVTTMRDPQGRRTVADLLPAGTHAVPVGRLDYDTAGVLLLTDDGELANRLLHPRFGVAKTYRAEIDGRLSPEDVRRLHGGVRVPEFRAASAKVRVVAVRRGRSIVELTIHEGRNRQVRRMFQALGRRVLALTRTSFGPLRLGELPSGHLRRLTRRERTALERHRRPPEQSPRTKRDTTIT